MSKENGSKLKHKSFISLGYKLEAIKDFNQSNYEYLFDEIIRMFQEIPLIYWNRIEYYENKVTGDKTPETFYIFFNKAPNTEIIRLMRNYGFDYYAKTVEWKIPFDNMNSNQATKRFLKQLGDSCKNYACLTCNTLFKQLPNFDKELSEDKNFRPSKPELVRDIFCPSCKGTSLKQDFSFLKQYTQETTPTKPVLESKPEIKNNPNSTLCDKCKTNPFDYKKTIKGKSIQSCFDCGL